MDARRPPLLSPHAVTHARRLISGYCEYGCAKRPAFVRIEKPVTSLYPDIALAVMNLFLQLLLFCLVPGSKVSDRYDEP